MFMRIWKRGAFLLLCSFYMVFFGVTAFGALVNLELFYDGRNHTYSAEEISISIDGQLMTDFTVPPVAIDDRTLVPARAVFEKLGAQVHWNGDTQEVIVTTDQNVVVIQVDNTNGNRNGTTFTMDVPPKIVNDSTMIPVRFVADAIGCMVDWDASTRTVLITTQNSAEIPAEPEQPETTPEPPIIPEIPSVEPPDFNSGEQNEETSGNTTIIDNETSNKPNPTGEPITVQSVSIPSGDNSQIFTINTSGAIEKYQTLIINGDRLAVDIYNAVVGISNNNIPVINNTYVTSVRSAQNQVEPIKITRVVFDLRSKSDYSIALSNDQKSIILNFAVNHLNQLSFQNDGSNDKIILSGDTAPSVAIRRFTNPDRLAIDVPNAVNGLEDSYSSDGAMFVSNIRTIQMDDKSTRIEMELNANVEYSIDTVGSQTVVSIYKSLLGNVSYDSNMHAIVLKNPGSLDIDRITHNDNYLDLEYTLTLPGDYQGEFGRGIFRINDKYMEDFEIRQNSQNQTEIKINETQIWAYSVIEDSDSIYIIAQKPKEKYSKVVVIDPGHGGNKPGASANNLVEKDLNLSIGLKVIDRLERDESIKVYATRLTDENMENMDRALMANDIAHLFVSIHQNSVEGGPKVNGTEVLYMDHNNEAPGNLTSKIAAQFLQNYITGAIGTSSRGIKERPDLIVLNQTTIPATLIECGFITNTEDAAKLSSDSYQEKYAEAIYSAIVDMMNQYPVN